jgi:hypothetical protein
MSCRRVVNGCGGSSSAANTVQRTWYMKYRRPLSTAADITIVDLVIWDIDQAQHVAFLLTQRFPVGIRNCEVRTSLFLRAYPAVGAATAAYPSHADFESTATRLKELHTRMAAPIRFGTAFAASQARLLVASPETWPAIRTTAQTRILSC